jgi:uncharacterized protein (PEP-CTERM system associated)
MLVVMLALPFGVRSADWTVLPSLRVRESYSDNARLTAQEQAVGERTSEVSPGIALITHGPRLALTLDYTLQSLHSNREGERRNQQLDAAAQLSVLPDWLFVDARAGISQQNISAFGPQQLDATQASANSTTVRTLAFSPSLRHDFRGLASLLARFDRSSVSSGHLLQVHSSDAALQLTGDRGGGTWNWDLRIDRQHIDDARLPPSTLEDAAFTLSYPLNRTLSLFATTGYERNEYQTLGDEPRGRYWSTGSHWQPSPRTDVSASVGRHYYGATYGLNASFQQRHMLWTLDYGEDITSTNGQFLSVAPAAMSDFLFQLWDTRIPDPIMRRQAIQAFIALSQLLGPTGNVNYFSHRYYLQKQWRLAALYAGSKTTWSLGLSSTGRTAQSSSAIDSALLIGPTDIALQDRTRQTSLQAGASWRLNGRSQISLSAGTGVAKSISNGRNDRNSALVLSMTRQLSSRVSLSADLRHSRHHSNAGGNYRENGVSAALSMQF